MSFVILDAASFPLYGQKGRDENHDTKGFERKWQLAISRADAMKVVGGASTDSQTKKGSFKGTPARGGGVRC